MQQQVPKPQLQAQKKADHHKTASSTFGDGEFKSRQNQWWVSLEHTLHRNFLMLGQPVIERMLAEKLGDDVHYNEQVASVSEDDDGVVVVTSSGRTIRSKYALGADGARSMVRKSIGATFGGTKPEMLWAVLDTFIDTDFPRCSEIITFQLNGQSRVSWIPRERGLCRFYVLLEGQVSRELAQQSIKDHMAPHKVEFTKTEWYSTFDGECAAWGILLVHLANQAAQSRSELLQLSCQGMAPAASSWEATLRTFTPSMVAKV